MSDYARPAARGLVRLLRSTPVMPVHLTLLSTACGLAAAYLLAYAQQPLLAAALILLKDLVDAADGSLARLRQRPSRVGRFLDSLCDFGVNAALFGALGWRAGALGLGAAALLCATLQCSVYSYYAVRYRAQAGGDRTSLVHEDDLRALPGDHPLALRLLHGLYQLIYRWQDEMVDWLDRRAAGAGAPLRPAFLTLTSGLGLGTQLAVLALAAAFGQAAAALWSFVTVFNLYAAVLFLIRALEARGHFRV